MRTWRPCGSSGSTLRWTRWSGRSPRACRSEVASQFMTTAAVQSKNQQELDAHLAPLRELGIDTAMDKVVGTLAQSLPIGSRLAIHDHRGRAVEEPAGAGCAPGALAGARDRHCDGQGGRDARPEPADRKSPRNS